MQIGKNFRPTPARTLRAIFMHSQWLASGGVNGRRLGSDGKIYDVRNQFLASVDLSMACIRFHDFEGSDVSSGLFIGAEADGTIWADCRIDQSRYNASSLQLASFVGIRKETAHFDGARMDYTLWTKKDQEAYLQRVRDRFDAVADNKRRGDEWPKTRAPFVAGISEHWKIWAQQKRDALVPFL